MPPLAVQTREGGLALPPLQITITIQRWVLPRPGWWAAERDRRAVGPPGAALVGGKGTGFPRDLFVFSGQANPQPPESAAGLFLATLHGAADRVAAGSGACGAAGAGSAPASCAGGRSVWLSAFGLGQHLPLAVWAEALHFHRVALPLPRQLQTLLLVFGLAGLGVCPPVPTAVRLRASPTAPLRWQRRDPSATPGGLSPPGTRSGRGTHAAWLIGAVAAHPLGKPAGSLPAGSPTPPSPATVRPPVPAITSLSFRMLLRLSSFQCWSARRAARPKTPPRDSSRAVANARTERVWVSRCGPGSGTGGPFPPR